MTYPRSQKSSADQTSILLKNQCLTRCSCHLLWHHCDHPAALASGWRTHPPLSDQGGLGPPSSLFLLYFIAWTILQTMPVALLHLRGLTSVLAFGRLWSGSHPAPPSLLSAITFGAHHCLPVNTADSSTLSIVPFWSRVPLLRSLNPLICVPVMSDSLQSHGSWLFARLLCHSPAKNTGVGCHSLFHLNSLTQIRSEDVDVYYTGVREVQSWGGPRPLQETLTNPLTTDCLMGCFWPAPFKGKAS